jgi:hypothetical protein
MYRYNNSVESYRNDTAVPGGADSGVGSSNRWGKLTGGTMETCDDFFRFQVTGAAHGTKGGNDAQQRESASIRSDNPVSSLLSLSGEDPSGGFGVALWITLPPPSTSDQPSKIGDESDPSKSNRTGRFLADDAERYEEEPILTLGRFTTTNHNNHNSAIPVWRQCGELYDLDVSYVPHYGEVMVRYMDGVDQDDDTGGVDDDGAPATAGAPTNDGPQRTCRSLRFSADTIFAASSSTSNSNLPESSHFGAHQQRSATHLAVLFTPHGVLVFGQGRVVAEIPRTRATTKSNATSSRLPLSPVSFWNSTGDHLLLFRDGTFHGGLHQVDFFVGGILSDATAREDRYIVERRVESLYEQGFVKPALGGNGGGGGDATGSVVVDDALVQLNPLQVNPDELRRIPQDSASPLELRVGGMVRWRRNVSAVLSNPSYSETEFAILWVNVTRIPVHGVVRVANSSTQAAMQEGDSLALPLPLKQVAIATLPLVYQLSDQEYYNLPSSHTGKVNGSRVDGEERLQATLSVVWQGAVLASESVGVDIEIQQVNGYPPMLIAPTRWVATNTTELAMSNVTLKDADPGSSSTPVRVDVSSKHSPMSLVLDDNHESYNGILNVSSLSGMYDDCHHRSDSPWQCTGVRGSSSAGSEGEQWNTATRRIIFVAAMDQVPVILNSFVTVRLDQGDDVLTIRVYDGQDGTGCLSAREHALYGSNWTLHRGCFMAEATVQLSLDPSVPKAGSLGEGAQADNSKISRLANLLFWGIVIVLVVGLVAWLRRCLPRCFARGSAVDADDDGDDADAEAGYQTDRDSSVSDTIDAFKVHDSPAGTLNTTAADDDLDTTTSF